MAFNTYLPGDRHLPSTADGEMPREPGFNWRLVLALLGNAIGWGLVLLALVTCGGGA